MRPERRLVSVRQFAALMGVSPHTVWRWAREGRISLYGVGRPMVDEAEALEQLRRQPAAATPPPVRGGLYREWTWKPTQGQAGRPRGQRDKRRPA